MSFKIRINADYNNPQTFRLGVLAGAILYSSFSILDLYMTPEGFYYAIKVRFFFVLPSLILPIFLSFFSWFKKFYALGTLYTLIAAQAGIFAIIFNAKPYEPAYYDYYIGLILLVLFGAFIFKLQLRYLIGFTLATWLVFSYHLVYVQKLPSYGEYTPQFAKFLNSHYFMYSVTAMAIVGSILIDGYYSILNKEKKNLEDALEKLKETDKMKSNFLSTMSHEIRTPLNGILGFSDILLKNPEPEDIELASKAIQRQGQSLLTILTGILDFSQLQSSKDLGEKEMFPVSIFLRRVYNSYEFQSKKYNRSRVSFAVHYNPEMYNHFIYIQPDSFVSIVTSILDNAVKFSSEGKIELTLEHTDSKAILVQIKDEGIGLDENISDKVFQHFQQVETGHNRKFDGIGMGLTIAQKIVQLMDGKIWYKKNKEAGTTFYILLPNCYKKI